MNRLWHTTSRLFSPDFYHKIPGSFISKVCCTPAPEVTSDIKWALILLYYKQIEHTSPQIWKPPSFSVHRAGCDRRTLLFCPLFSIKLTQESPLQVFMVLSALCPLHIIIGTCILRLGICKHIQELLPMLLQPYPHTTERTLEEHH